MRTPILCALLAGLAAPAGAQDVRASSIVLIPAVPAQSDRERQQADRERQREQAERDRERARQQAQKLRDSARDRSLPGQEQERTTRTLRIGANGELRVSNVAGDITITRGSGNEATVEIVETARAQTADEARELLKLVDVEVVERGNRAEIATRYPHDEMRRGNRRNMHVSVQFNVTVPATARVRANSVSGSISAKDVRGDLALETVSGTVRVSGAGRVGSAKSISGDVEVSDSDSDGLLSASSASGSIALRRVKARQLDISSISGEVVLEEVESGAIEAKSVSGRVRFSGPLARNARYEMSSHSGSVEIGVTGGSGFELEATTFSGAVRSDFPLGAQGDSSRRHGPREIRAVVGDGSAVLELTSFSGNIVITKR